MLTHITTKQSKHIFFLGIGGIGMSALARYFHAQGSAVYGYDRTASALTRALEDEGIPIIYEDSVEKLPVLTEPLVVWTPAVPKETALYRYFSEQGQRIYKRSEVLGMITSTSRALCVAGTHGKTTTSTLLAHLLHESHLGTNAFLGGISRNYHTNLLLNSDAKRVVVEADEFDRSFLHLHPAVSVVTSADPDHLDIYGTEEAYRQGFVQYCHLVSDTLLLKLGLAEKLQGVSSAIARIFTYALDDPRADYFAKDIHVGDGRITFTLHCPDAEIENLELGVPVWVNIENSVAALAIARMEGLTEDELRYGLRSFAGVERRFAIHLQTPQIAYIDDYAHHPQELAASIESVRRLYPERHLIGIFQPHLYTRTRDFATEFAQVLSQLDEVILLPIYPAREEPIAGVDSEMLLRQISCKHKHLLSKEVLLDYLPSLANEMKPVVVMTLGAGDIDRLVGAIALELGKVDS